MNAFHAERSIFNDGGQCLPRISWLIYERQPVGFCLLKEQMFLFIIVALTVMLTTNSRTIVYNPTQREKIHRLDWVIALCYAVDHSTVFMFAPSWRCSAFPCKRHIEHSETYVIMKPLWYVKKYGLLRRSVASGEWYNCTTCSPSKLNVHKC